MAKINKDGHPIGKLANVVYTTVNGVRVVRSRPVWRGRYKPTAKQIQNQKKFKFAMMQMRNFRDFLKLTIETEPGRTINSAAMRTLLNQAIVGVHPDLSLDCSRMMVAKGSLPPATGGRVEATEPGILKFSWTDETESGKGYAWANNSFLIAYDPVTQEIVAELNGPTRRMLSGELKIPGFLCGIDLHCWIAFRTIDFKLKSDSVYVGVVQAKV